MNKYTLSFYHVPGFENIDIWVDTDTDMIWE